MALSVGSGLDRSVYKALIWLLRSEGSRPFPTVLDQCFKDIGFSLTLDRSISLRVGLTPTHLPFTREAWRPALRLTLSVGSGLDRSAYEALIWLLRSEGSRPFPTVLDQCFKDIGFSLTLDRSISLRVGLTPTHLPFTREAWRPALRLTLSVGSGLDRSVYEALRLLLRSEGSRPFPTCSNSLCELCIMNYALNYPIGSKSATPCLHSGQMKSSGSSSPS